MIREMIRESGFPHWRVAERAGISENTMVRWLRHEPDGERRERILQAIQELRKEAEERAGEHKAGG